MAEPASKGANSLNILAQLLSQVATIGAGYALAVQTRILDRERGDASTAAFAAGQPRLSEHLRRILRAATCIAGGGPGTELTAVKGIFTALLNRVVSAALDHQGFVGAILASTDTGRNFMGAQCAGFMRYYVGRLIAMALGLYARGGEPLADGTTLLFPVLEGRPQSQEATASTRAYGDGSYGLQFSGAASSAQRGVEVIARGDAGGGGTDAAAASDALSIGAAEQAVMLEAFAVCAQHLSPLIFASIRGRRVSMTNGMAGLPTLVTQLTREGVWDGNAILSLMSCLQERFGRLSSVADGEPPAAEALRHGRHLQNIPRLLRIDPMDFGRILVAAMYSALTPLAGESPMSAQVFASKLHRLFSILRLSVRALISGDSKTVAGEDENLAVRMQHALLALVHDVRQGRGVRQQAVPGVADAAANGRGAATQRAAAARARQILGSLGEQSWKAASGGDTGARPGRPAASASAIGGLAGAHAFGQAAAAADMTAQILNVARPVQGAVRGAAASNEQETSVTSVTVVVAGLDAAQLDQLGKKRSTVAGAVAEAFSQYTSGVAGKLMAFAAGGDPPKLSLTCTDARAATLMRLAYVQQPLLRSSIGKAIIRLLSPGGSRPAELEVQLHFCTGEALPTPAVVSGGGEAAENASMSVAAAAAGLAQAAARAAAALLPQDVATMSGVGGGGRSGSRHEGDMSASRRQFSPTVQAALAWYGDAAMSVCNFMVGMERGNLYVGLITPLEGQPPPGEGSIDCFFSAMAFTYMAVSGYGAQMHVGVVREAIVRVAQAFLEHPSFLGVLRDQMPPGGNPQQALQHMRDELRGTKSGQRPAGALCFVAAAFLAGRRLEIVIQRGDGAQCRSTELKPPVTGPSGGRGSDHVFVSVEGGFGHATAMIGDYAGAGSSTGVPLFAATEEGRDFGGRLTARADDVVKWLAERDDDAPGGTRRRPRGNDGNDGDAAGLQSAKRPATGAGSA